MLDGAGVHALEALELAAVVLHHVVPAAHGAGVLDLDVLVGGAGGLDQLDQVLVVALDGRVAPPGGGVELVGQRPAEGTARVAGHHHEVTGAQRLAGDLQPLLRLVRDVVLAVRCRLAVRTDVGAVEGEVAGVTRPHPVVDVAAIAADAVGRGVHQADVADLQVPEQAVVVAAQEAVEVATVALPGLAVSDQLLLQVLQRVGTGMAVAGRFQGATHLRGHVGDPVQDVDARVRARGQLVAPGGGVEAQVDEVVVGGRVELDRAIGAVVVGDHQALRGDEAGGAAAQ